MSKGSHRRNEDIGKIWDNWDSIFGKKEKQQEEQPVKEPTQDKDAPEENAK